MLTNLTPADKAAIVDTANRLGISPADLAAVMAYETIGTMNPDIRGGANRAYEGLIQFGPSERKAYGYKRGMSFADQVSGPVFNFLRDRGIKPGMGLAHLYSVVNAGSLGPGGKPRWGARDKNGTLAQHVARIKTNYLPRALSIVDGKAGALAADGDRALRKGMTGDDVRALQGQLASAGLYRGKIDGDYGKQTAAAVRAAESLFGLSRDRGVAGPQVRSALASAGRTQDIMSALAVPGPSIFSSPSVTPAEVPMSVAMGRSPPMPWDVSGRRTGAEGSPELAGQVPIGASARPSTDPGSTLLETTMGAPPYDVRRAGIAGGIGAPPQPYNALSGARMPMASKPVRTFSIGPDPLLSEPTPPSGEAAMWNAWSKSPIGAQLATAYDRAYQKALASRPQFPGVWGEQPQPLIAGPRSVALSRTRSLPPANEKLDTTPPDLLAGSRHEGDRNYPPSETLAERTVLAGNRTGIPFYDPLSSATTGSPKDQLSDDFGIQLIGGILRGGRDLFDWATGGSGPPVTASRVGRHVPESQTPFDMPQPWGGTEAHTLDEMRQYLESKAAKPRPQSFDYAPPSSGSGGLPRATGGSGANMAAAFFPAHAAADFGMSSHVPGIAVPAGHGFAGGPEPGGSMYPARWATPGFFAGRGTGELPPAGMAVPPIPLGSRSGFGRTPGVGPRATADLVPWSVAPAALRAVGPPAAAVPPVRSSASLPPLPHPPAVSIAALARPLGNAGRIAGHNIAALLNGPLSGLFGGFLGGADTGTFAAGQTAAHPAAVSNGNPYGMSPLAAVGWNMPSFSPGSGGSSDAYRTNTGWTVDQYGARVPTGSYVNSAGKTITYAMA